MLLWVFEILYVYMVVFGEGGSGGVRIVVLPHLQLFFRSTLFLLGVG